jgi:hypothetical protein
MKCTYFLSLIILLSATAARAKPADVLSIDENLINTAKACLVYSPIRSDEAFVVLCDAEFAMKVEGFESSFSFPLKSREFAEAANKIEVTLNFHGLKRSAIQPPPIGAIQLIAFVR